MAKLDMASLNMEHNLAGLDQKAYIASLQEISDVAKDLAQTQHSDTAYPYIQTLLHHDPTPPLLSTSTSSKTLINLTNPGSTWTNQPSTPSGKP